MTRIQSSTGLITGIPIEETVNKLMEIAKRPRDTLDDRNDGLKSEQLAVNQLSSLVLAFQFESNRFGAENVFQAKSVNSSDTDVLAAALATGGNPAIGSQKLRVLQTATSQQLVSGGFADLDDLAGSGSLSFGFGGFVDTGTALANLNGGAGVKAGKIRIIDRAGNSADIDLRVARTVDDVLRAINSNEVIDVTASVDGDRFVLSDSSGGSGTLRVQEVGGGTTAASLGLAGINVAADSATGTDVFQLGTATSLASLNDASGVELRTGADLAVTLRDGTSLNIDLGAATTLGDVLTAIKAANPAKLSASISADGNRLQLTDLTAGGGTFAVANVGTGSAASDLGLTTTAAGGTLTGSRLVSGLRDTLVGSLRGGAGLGTLGEIDITNRNNVTSTVNLAGAETLDGVVDAINSQATGVTAAINSARNGIVLTDTTGATASNLIVANGDSTNTATSLGLAASVAATTVNSGTLSRQQISRATLLSSLNGGDGVGNNDFRITDSAGHTATVDMNTVGNEAKTIGDVIDRINALAIGVDARINDTGDGILLIDTAGGSDGLKVSEAGTGTSAADLNLLRKSNVVEIDGQDVSVIDGSSRYEVDLGGLDDPAANVLLSSLNKGKGMDAGAFRITDSAGKSDVVVLNSSAGTFTTVADVIDAINATDIGIEARLDPSKSGILLFDTAGGSGKLAVEELAGGTTAASLGLTKPVRTTSVDGKDVQAIDGVGVFTQPADASALATLATRINSLGAGVTASTVFDGENYRLALSVDKTGAGHELLVDGLDVGLDFQEFGAAQDAAVELGGSFGSSGVVVTSGTNEFNNVIAGVNLTVVEPSDKTISVDVSSSNTQMLDVAQDFVDAYNSVRKFLDDTTSFDSEELTTGILFGTQVALRTDSDMSRVVTAQYFGVGQFTTLAAVGVTVDANGKLALDKTKFQAAFDKDPGAVTKLFTDKNLGISTKLKSATDQLVGGTNSTLSARVAALGSTIQKNTERIESMDASLDRQRERLMNQFAALETTIASLQQNLTA
ncbi:MAG: flagellar filament capping protein FliD, partial [Pirellulales bacterium]